MGKCAITDLNLRLADIKLQSDSLCHCSLLQCSLLALRVFTVISYIACIDVRDLQFVNVSCQLLSSVISLEKVPLLQIYLPPITVLRKLQNIAAFQNFKIRENYHGNNSERM